MKRRRRPGARGLAVRVLRDVRVEASFSNRALSEHLERASGLDPRDRGLVTMLVYGVLRHRTRLDAHIDAHARAPNKLRGELRDILRVATYELLELGRPAPIAIAEATRSVEGLDRSGRLVSVAQAVLGAVDRSKADIDESLATGSPLDVLERRWSIPRWLAGRWLRQLGPPRALARARAVAEPLPVDLRVDIGRIDPDDAAQRLQADHPQITIDRVDERPQALRTRGGGDLFYGPLHEEGLVSVQGLAAQQPAIVLAPQPGERILDACAGMGVKTLQLAELMQRRGFIVAADADATSLAQVDSALARGRVDRDRLVVETVVADLAQAVRELDEAPFDAVLLDAPCTGLGNLARHPEVRWSRRFEDIGARAQLQATLLERCWDRMRPAGRMVYAVCSLEPEEGPERVRALAVSRSAEVVDERAWTPETDATEGFYVARLEGR